MSVAISTFKACDLPCKSVTVYTDRAEVKRLVKTKLKTGQNEVLIKCLPKAIDKESVRVIGRGEATICSVTYKEMPDVEMETKQKGLSDKLTKLQDKRKELDDELHLLERKKGVLDGVANQVSNGVKSDSEKSETKAISLGDDTMENLDKFIAFYSEKWTVLAGKVRGLEKEKNCIDEDIKGLKSDINELQGTSVGQKGTYLACVSISLDSPNVDDAELDVTYVVNEASWSPSYDFRVYTADNKKNLKVLYNGRICQNTGEDWIDTELYLSTAIVSIGGEVPELITLKASLNKRPKQAQKRHRSTSEVEPVAKREKIEMKESVICTSFHVGRPTTIPSDKASHEVNVIEVDLDPVFKHESVPSKSQYAYLKAKTINPDPHPFLAGPVYVFLDNNFVAKSSLKAVSPNEEFTCSLGADPAVRVRYKPAHVFYDESGLCSKNTVETHDLQISVKNTHVKDEILLKVLEQVPLSTDEKLKVTLLKPEIPKLAADRETCEYRLNKDNILEWDVKLAPGLEKEFEIKWSLEYQKNETVELKEEH